MKLKGTITEGVYRAELLRSYNYIFNSLEGEYLNRTLTQTFLNMKTAYILYWTPEQGEDLYTILVDGETIAFIEIEEIYEKKWLFKKMKSYRTTKLSTCLVKDFNKGLSKTNQIKLEVALDLSKREIEHKR